MYCGVMDGAGTASPPTSSCSSKIWDKFSRQLRRSNTYGSYKRCGAFVCSRHCIAHDMTAQVAPDDLRQLIATVTAAWDIRVCEGSRIEIDYLLPEDCRALPVGGGSRAGVVKRPPEVYNAPSGRTSAEPSPAE
jgi:hypothetical protein